MKKTIFLSLGLILSLSAATKVQAQSLKDILNSKAAKGVLETLKESNAVSAADLVGCWNYTQPACRLQSDDPAHKLGAVAVQKGVAGKLSEIYTKLNITPQSCSYTFNSDSTFVNRIGKRELKGRYSFDPATSKLRLRYLSMIPIDVDVRKSGSDISLLFNADHLLQFLKWASGKSKSEMVNKIGELAAGYNGLLLGYEVSHH